LHAHLNGSIPANHVVSLLEQNGIPFPDGLTAQDLVLRSPVSCLPQYFKPWTIFKLLPIGKQCLDAMVDAAVAALGNDHVKYAEFRNSPFNIADLNEITLDETVEWLVDSLAGASARRDVDTRLVVSLSRYKSDLHRSHELWRAIGRANRTGIVVGVDLSGNEDAPIDGAVARLFREAKDSLGLGVTVHAGETGNPATIRWAVNECKADRIAHALAAAHDASLLEELAARDICVEVCLTSNLFSGQVDRLEDHPVRHFIEHAVPFVLCTDNPQVLQTCLSQEYELFLSTFGKDCFIEDMLQQQQRRSFAR